MHTVNYSQPPAMHACVLTAMRVHMQVDLPQAGPAMAPSGNMRGRAAGFKSDGGSMLPGGSNDLTAIRDAARQAADAQKVRCRMQGWVDGRPLDG